MQAGNDRPAQDLFWERAGRLGYGQALFRSRRVERHVLEKQWRVAVETAERIGVRETAAVLELGCGDGEFAAEVLAPRYRRVDAVDKSETAIERARARPARENVRFAARDITALEYGPDERWDAAFLMGALHHIKAGAPAVVARLARVAPKVVVLEPNGNNLIRRCLERLPSYREAGEQSFRLREILALFEASGYHLRARAPINLFPPFTPDPLFPLVRGVERIVETVRPLRRLCSSYVLGFSRDG